MANDNPLASFPSSEDAKYAKEQGMFYGTPIESYAYQKVANVLGQDVPNRDLAMQKALGKSGLPSKQPPMHFEARSAAGNTLTELFNHIGKVSKNIDLTLPEHAGIRDAIGDTYARAAIAINRIPLAALGFDPSISTMDTKIKSPTLAGAYNPKTDKIYANLANPGVLVHESIHRGMQKLKAKPELKPFFDNLPDDESVVRYLMATQAGDIEKGSGRVADEQRNFALQTFSGALGRQRMETLDGLMKVAQQEIARIKPGGPR
jgi:hypothetical protein